MNDSERVLIVDACRALIHRYAYLNDARDFDQLAELFTDDAVFYRPSAPDDAIIGRDAILKSLMARPPNTITFHLCTDVLVDVESPQRARARSRILLLSGTLAADGNHPDPTTLKPLLPGTFRDELVLTASGWKFSRRIGRVWLAD
jgi:ketosteroid isomerase-like protein